VPKGEWQSWREEKCPRVKERMAQVYMQLARRREDIESELEKTPDLSLRAARQLITASPKRRRTSTPGEKKPQEDKPELPDWVVAYNESSDTDKAAGIAHIVTDLLTYMSAADRDKLMVRALGNAAEHAPTKKQRNAIREAQKPYLDGIPYTRIN
jgi:proteasome lid subunit RPN8/RPN11